MQQNLYLPFIWLNSYIPLHVYLVTHNEKKDKILGYKVVRKVSQIALDTQS